MKRIIIITITIISICAGNCSAFWLWTPETNKWVNPKYSVKETPKEQLDYGLEFLNAQEFKKAINEFEKLIKHYPRATEAPKAQWYIGECFEKLDDPYKAFQEYQKIIDMYPFSDLAPEVVERQYKIGEKMLLTPSKNRFISTLTGGEYDVIDVFRTVIKNAPYGNYAPIAQYKIGLYLAEKKMYSEARDELEKVINDYPDNEWVKPARYQIAVVDSARSPGAAYDQRVTQAAAEGFEDFIKTYPDAQLSEKARSEISELREKEAENNFLTAKFYQKQKDYEAAKIYYLSIIDEFSGNQWAIKALEQIKIIEEKTK
ncbi:MAG: outer membrane protein assembly factor BamD [Candidatus Omnitrophica bacterium]|nr:outer membrane protein assembly factor BamD [Candidatus Omnitrophota bacterium]